MFLSFLGKTGIWCRVVHVLANQPAQEMFANEYITTRSGLFSVKNLHYFDRVSPGHPAGMWLQYG
jgi:hypothetical protein